MNTLVTVLLLGAIHTSIVALAVLVARLCLRRSAAGGRALVGAMGMACVLAVTGAAALPLHGMRRDFERDSLARGQSARRRCSFAGVEHGTAGSRTPIGRCRTAYGDGHALAAHLVDSLREWRAAGDEGGRRIAARLEMVAHRDLHDRNHDWSGPLGVVPSRCRATSPCK